MPVADLFGKVSKICDVTQLIRLENDVVVSQTVEFCECWWHEVYEFVDEIGPQMNTDWTD
jgi:hypothetical protein